MALVFSPDGKYLLSGDLLGTILLWDLSTRQAIELSDFGEDGGSIEDLSFSPDGKTLAVLSRDGRVRGQAVIIADQARDIRQDGLGRRFAGQGV